MSTTHILYYILLFAGAALVSVGTFCLTPGYRNIHPNHQPYIPLTVLLFGAALMFFAGPIANALVPYTAGAVCTNCGTELAGEFCHKCGAAADAVVKCAKCGLEAIGEFCHGCGAAIK